MSEFLITKVFIKITSNIDNYDVIFNFDFYKFYK